MADQLPGTLLDAFNCGACLDHNHIAVVFYDGNHEQSLTYEALQVKANMLAESLRRLYCGEIVGIAVEPGIEVPVALLGILSVPAAYYPVDTNTGATQFIANVIERLQLKAFVISINSLSVVNVLRQAGFSDVIVHELPALELSIVTLSTNHIFSSGTALTTVESCNQLAYVITTSGTTGIPKIVRVPHKCIVPNITHISEIYALSSEDLVFQASPLTFDPSVVEIFTTFYVGATLLLVSNAIRVRPYILAHCLADRYPVTVIQATPSLMSRFGAALLRKTLLRANSLLRIMSLGGERCPDGSTLQQWRDTNNQTTFINIYGVTEVSCWATWYQLSNDDLQLESSEIPLGNALIGTELDVRNVDIGTGVGELWIGGKHRVCQIDDECLPAELGAMRFSGDLVRQSKQGVIHYCGRQDDMVKRNGKRFHLQEIEKVVCRHKSVVQAAVVFLNQQLLLVFVKLNAETIVIGKTADLQMKESITGASSGTDYKDEVSIHMNADTVTSNCAVLASINGILYKELIELVQQWLPAHCRPDNILVVRDMPVTKHGKVDKVKLKEWYDGERVTLKRSLGSLSWTDIYELVSTLWKDIVSVQQLADKGRWQSRLFTECGGSSLAAVQLANDITFSLNLGTRGELMLSFLTDTILHGSLIDVVTRLCHELGIAARVDDIDSAASYSGEHHVVYDGQLLDATDNADKNELSRTPLVAGTAHNAVENTDGSVNHEPQPAIRSLSSLEKKHMLPDSPFSRSKRFRRTGNYCKEGDEVRLSRTNVDSSSDIAASINVIDTTECHCCTDINEQTAVGNSVCSFSRGSSRVVCCHSVMSSNSWDSKCCVINGARSKAMLQTAFRLQDGIDISLEVLWQYNTGKCIDASPLVVVCDGNSNMGHVYVGSHSHRFVAVSVEDGSALWEAVLGGRIESSAAISRCLQYLVVGCYDGKVYVIDRVTGRIEWAYQTWDVVKSSPCINPISGIVYVGSHDKHVHAIDIQRRSCSWKYNLDNSSVFSSPCLCLCPYQLTAATLGGLVAALHPDSGNLVWQHSIGKPLFSSPAPYEHGYIIGCVDGSIYAISHSGNELWQYRTDQAVFSTSCVVHPHLAMEITTPVSTVHRGSVAVIGSHDQNVYCLSSFDRSLIWKVTVDSEIYSTPSVTDWGDAGSSQPAVTVCSKKGTVYVLELSSGQILSQLSIQKDIFSSPVCVNGRILVGCRDNHVYCLKLRRSSRNNHQQLDVQ